MYSDEEIRKERTEITNNCKSNKNKLLEVSNRSAAVCTATGTMFWNASNCVHGFVACQVR